MVRERSRVRVSPAAPSKSLHSKASEPQALPFPPRFKPEQVRNVPQKLGENWGNPFADCSPVDPPPDPGNAKAAPIGPRNGSQNEKRCGGAFNSKYYSTARALTIPSPEKPDRMAHVVRCGERLFAVGYHVGGAL